MAALPPPNKRCRELASCCRRRRYRRKSRVHPENQRTHSSRGEAHTSKGCRRSFGESKSSVDQHRTEQDHQSTGSKLSSCARRRRPNRSRRRTQGSSTAHTTRPPGANLTPNLPKHKLKGGGIYTEHRFRVSSSPPAAEQPPEARRRRRNRRRKPGRPAFALVYCREGERRGKTTSMHAMIEFVHNCSNSIRSSKLVQENLCCR